MKAITLFLMSGALGLVATGALAAEAGRYVSYEQKGEPAGTCQSSPAALCNYQGPAMELTEKDVYDRTHKIFKMVRNYYTENFKMVEPVKLDGTWMSQACYTVDPISLAPTSAQCNDDGSIVKINRKGTYNGDNTITITERGQLFLQKNANPQFPQGGDMTYQSEVTYAPKKQ